MTERELASLRTQPKKAEEPAQATLQFPTPATHFEAAYVEINQGRQAERARGLINGAYLLRLHTLDAWARKELTNEMRNFLTKELSEVIQLLSTE